MIDHTWTLFLDRDGVINERLPGAYIADWADFQFRPGVLTAITYFSTIFGRIIVVTNQQGIGKALMSEVQLNQLHGQMLKAIEAAGGRIDAIYFCPDLKSKQLNCRKPAPAMALQAQADFPAISFEHSIIVGDSLSDIEFGCNLNMKTILIESKLDELDKINQSTHIYINYRFQHLWEIAEAFEEDELF